MHTKLVVLDTRLNDYEFNKEQTDIKVGRLKIAMVLLTAAVVLVLIGAGLQLLLDVGAHVAPDIRQPRK